MSTLRSVRIRRRSEVLGADAVMEPECWNCRGPVTATARTMPSGVDDQKSGIVARSGVVAREGSAA
jgi:hypothetical protein